MTEKPSPTPSFDPQRSAAIRAMLQDEVRATTSRRRPSARVLGLSSLAVLAGIAVSGTAAFAITGGAIFGALPAEQTPQPTVTSTITLTPTPTPTAAPVAPPEPANPPAPVLRVPASCDDLVALPAVRAVLGEKTESVEHRSAFRPTDAADERVGALNCSWTTGDDMPGISLAVVPEATAEAVENQVRNGVTAPVTASDISPSAREVCQGSSCQYASLAGSYGVQMWAETSPDAQDAARSLFADVVTAVAALAEPEPLWQPSGPTMNGAADCSEVVSVDALSGILGIPMAEIDPASMAQNWTLGSAGMVEGISCGWVSLDDQQSTSMSVSVLPGGASFFTVPDADSYLQPTTDYPGRAWLSTEGQAVEILLDDGWISISAPADRMHAVVDAVLANVGPR